MQLFKRTITLEEMLLLLASEFAEVWPKLAGLHMGFAMGGENRPTKEEVHSTLGELSRLSGVLGWRDLRRQTVRLMEHIADGTKDEVLEVLCVDLQSAFGEKSREIKLVAVLEQDSALIEDAAKALCAGPLHSDLAYSEEELNLAGRCAALGLSTAAVSHAMRAVEASLHALCGALGITFPGSIELQDFKVLTEKITSEIALWQSRPRTPEKSEQLKKFGELLVPADGFRLAWRNHVAHARDKYEDTEARAVLRYVADFLKRLSDGLR